MEIVRPHTRFFEVSPRVSQGDTVAFSHLDPANPAWFFGRDAGQTEGYFPLAWFEVADAGKSGRARRNYDASELSVAVGDPVEVIEKYGGWVLASRGNEVGWIPEACINGGVV